MLSLYRQMVGGGGLVSTTVNGTPQPEGNVIARGEDGVPWELYENGYLLFKPVAGKDTLTNNQGETSWKVNHGSKIKYVGFAGKVYAPINSSRLFSTESEPYHNHNFNPITINTIHFDTSKVTNMSHMFERLSNVTNLDVTNFDTSNVTTMYDMFSNMSKLTHLDVTNFNTSKVTDMSHMFFGMRNLTSLDVTNFDTRNVTNMAGMFATMHNVTDLDVTHFDTSKVTDMNWMFYGMSNLASLDVTHFDTHNVTNMESMFADMLKLTNLDVTHFDTSNVTNMSLMFHQLTHLASLDVTHFDTRKVTNMNAMFAYMDSLTTLDLSSFDMSRVVAIPHSFNLFKNTPKLKELKLGDKFKADGIRTIPIYHRDNDQYTEKWHKVNDKAHPYTISDWANLYNSNPTAMAGTWVREEKVQDATLKFQGEDFTPVKVKPSDTTLPTLQRPSQPKQNHKFLGWSKDGRNPITREEVKPGETITLQPLWQPVNNTTTRTEAIPVTTTYRGDDNLDTGKRQETPGTPGEKRITTTYTSAPYTGELTNPANQTDIIRDMVPKVITIGTKPTVAKSNPVPKTTRVNKDTTKPLGYKRVDTEGFDGYTETVTHYDVNSTTGNVTERTETRVVPPVERVVTEGALTYDLPTTGTADMTITLAGLSGALVITKRKKSK